MSTRKQPSNIIRRLVKQVWRFFQYLTKALINWFLRTLFVLKRRTGQNQAGFVLPTIVMVMLVVILLTTAILFRSFNRPKNAINMRVDQATYASATPALERARAKLKYLFSPDEIELEVGTPTENSIASVFEKPRYTFGDEIQLKVAFDYLTIDAASGDITAQKPDGIVTPTTATRPSPEQLQTAWKFPVDTDNDGLFDSFTLYGIYYRNPEAPSADNGIAARKRGPIEARALPQDEGQSEGCSSGSAGGSPAGWTVQSNGQLKKAFFTYVATVPITDLGGLDSKKYKTYKGSKGFSGLEMQIDQARISLDNNAVWYNDDLEIIDPTAMNLNGRIHTNGNLVVYASAPDNINFRQVSSKNSCFYQPENAKIVVGGNVAYGKLDGAVADNNLVEVHLFQGVKKDPDQTNWQIKSATTTTSNNKPEEVAYNTGAYAKRLDVLGQGGMSLFNRGKTLAQRRNNPPTKASVAAMAGRYPEELIKDFTARVEKCEPDCPNSKGDLEKAIAKYFDARIRRVPYAEIPIDKTAEAVNVGASPQTGRFPPETGKSFVFAGGGEIAAPLEWMKLEAIEAKLPLKVNGSEMDLPANEPTSGNKIEKLIGDRIIVGNGLPTRWVKKEDPLEYAKNKEAQEVKFGGTQIQWKDTGKPRKRTSGVEQLDDLGDTSRGGYWEQAAAVAGTLKDPSLKDIVGGLRVITGAGIYVDGRPIGRGTGKRLAEDTTPGKTDVKSFLPSPPTLDELKAKGIFKELPYVLERRDEKRLIVVWPDTMPMYQPASGSGLNAIPELKGDLQMRATVVYHYVSSSDTDQAPIACISSYYDPTKPDNAKNLPGLPYKPDTKGKSNNGISYDASTLAGLRTSPDSRLQRQSLMIFPDGRLVNEHLYTALNTDAAKRTLSENAALDAAHCALSILDGAAPAQSPVPDGAIQEKAFLDARQIKALHKPENTANGSLNPDGTPATGVAVNEKTFLVDITEPNQQEIAQLGTLLTLKDARYDLPMEQRQPLEVRVTEINLGQAAPGITRVGVGGTPANYLVPNSGIIYASRDDALADISSDPFGTSQLSTSTTTPSSADFKLDPTRRPNGIRLINGANLSRNNDRRIEEKGFILVSDLPVYIKGDFNVHSPTGDAGNQIEEFREKVADDYSNFYTRRIPLERGFAKRPGDTWRGARILSDAVTLLSEDYRDGYRSEGNYDFNNNAGNWNIEPRLKNGFWWNSFATSSDWYNPGTGLPKTDFVAQDGKTEGSSYVMNDITPIQRRATFPAYLMEACTKKPVSECGPDDWFVQKGPGNKAGTTADAKGTGIFADAVRRVAFKRDANNRQLELVNGFAQPIGVNGTALKYESGTTLGQVAALRRDNALWFWTTSDNTDPHPGSPTRSKPSYNSNTLPYYEEAEEIVSEKQLFLPGIPEVPEYELLGVPTTAVVDALKTLKALNGITTTDASDYAVCGASNSSKASDLTLTGTPCPTATLTTIANARKALVNLTDYNQPNGKAIIAVNKSLNRNNQVQSPVTITESGTLTLIPTAKVNVYDLPTDGRLATSALLNLTLDRGNQSDPIFIFRMPASGTGRVRFGNGANEVKLTLKGVSPNNIFWVSDKFAGMQFNTPATSNLVGNFLGLGRLRITSAPNLPGVRFLGFRQMDAIPAATTKAITSTDEPLLVPVLQLHSPNEGTPNGSAAAAFEGGGNKPMSDTWLPRAKDTTFNAVLIMGDSPSRPLGTNKAEDGGGLPNFPRFLEAWEESKDSNVMKAKINGSFIQFRRSNFATAPFEVVEELTRDTSLFFDSIDGNPPDYNITSGEYKYKGGSSSNKAPYYRPPQRAWGYDVGLLSQTPDLFSKRFATPTVSVPNEYYREIGKDDEWVKPLLCAAQKADPTDPTSPFTTPAVGTIKERPASCPSIGSYN